MEVDKYIKSLLDEELKVEYSIHNFDSSDPEADEKFRNEIEKELQKTRLPLGKSHLTGDPNSEVILGQDIYDSLEKSIAPIQDPSRERLQQVLYRSIHWKKRLQRLKNSFGEVINVTNQISKFRRLGQEVQNALNTILTAKAVDSDSEVKSDATTTNFGTGTKTSLHKDKTNQGAPTSHQESTLEIEPSKARSISERVANNDGTNLREATTKTEVGGTTRPTSVNEMEERLSQMDVHYNNNQEPVVRNRSMDDRHAGSYQYRHYQPRWKLNFDGSTNGLDVHDFIFRLDTFARRDGYPPHRLPAIIHSFVTDTAEKWLWAYTRDNPDASWMNMRSAFISRFSSHETEREKKRFIERLKQNHSSFNDYSLEVQSLNGRLSDRFKQKELIELLRENMHPALRTVTLQLHFDTVEHLRQVCQQYERLWSKSGFDLRNSVESPSRRPRINEIVSHSTVRETSLNLEPHLESEEKAVISGLQHDIKSSQVANHLICWNCKDIGHRYQDCTKEFLEIFCFGCGKAGIRKPNCSNCVRYATGNYVPGAAYAGTARPGQPPIPRK